MHFYPKGVWIWRVQHLQEYTVNCHEVVKDHNSPSSEAVPWQSMKTPMGSCKPLSKNSSKCPLPKQVCQQMPMPHSNCQSTPFNASVFSLDGIRP